MYKKEKEKQTSGKYNKLDTRLVFGDLKIVVFYFLIIFPNEKSTHRSEVLKNKTSPPRLLVNPKKKLIYSIGFKVHYLKEIHC